MTALRIVVVKLTDSFSNVWDQLGSDVGVAVTIVEDRDPGPSADDIAAVVLAAGGAEQAVFDWLDGHDTPHRVPLYVVGADAGRRTATQIAARGASDYFALPEDIELMHNTVAAAVSRRRDILRRSAKRREDAHSEAFAEIIGESPALKEVLARANRVLPHADASVLIVGETGTGKELLARAIHDGGPRQGAPFVAVNCSALPENLIESELFGHERGAFTDAHSSKPGLFEVAEGGTLFLDELGTLPINLQAKLLRVLQEKEVRRVGGTRTRTIDVRVVAATNEDLSEALRTGTFRKDLYFRLGVITLQLPPLRERGDDVVVIAETLIKRAADAHRLPTPALTNDARRLLLSYHWPGNVRELKNAVERAVLLSPPGELDVSELAATDDVGPGGSGPIPFPADLSEITMAAARATVELCSGNRSEAARRLGISRRRLRRLLDEELLTA